MSNDSDREQERKSNAERYGEQYFREANCSVRHSNSKIHNPEAWNTKLESLKGSLDSSWTKLLCGERGTGKTQLATQLIKRQCLWRARSARYEKVVGFFMAIKGTYGKHSSKSESRVLDEYTLPDLLVLDEAHERSESEWENRLLTYLIDRRYDAMKKTLLISNLTAADFVKSVGQSIASRLAETGGIIECSWPSFRVQK